MKRLDDLIRRTGDGKLLYFPIVHITEESKTMRGEENPANAPVKPRNWYPEDGKKLSLYTRFWVASLEHKSANIEAKPVHLANIFAIRRICPLHFSLPVSGRAIVLVDQQRLNRKRRSS